MDTNTITEPPEFIEIDNEKIATRHRDGNNPDVFWLGGYRSNMLGTKAQAIDEWTKTGLSSTKCHSKVSKS